MCHTGAVGIEQIMETLAKPIKLLQFNLDDLWHYYLYYKYKRKYVRVIVKYLNGEGYIVTSYFMGNIQ
jgi:hypothetical protein